MRLAKQSKMVSRYHPEEDAPRSDCCSGDFWDRLGHQQSSHWMEDYRLAPSLLTSGCTVQRPAGAEGGSFAQPASSALQKLPSPRELCRRKRKEKRPRRTRPGSLGASSVLHHLEELKGRLKDARWGVPAPRRPHGAVEGAADLPPGAARPGGPPSPVFRPPQAPVAFGGGPPAPGAKAGRVEEEPLCLLCPEWAPATRAPPARPPPGPPLPFLLPRGAPSKPSLWGSGLPAEE